jgi:guanylate kinase
MNDPCRRGGALSIETSATDWSDLTGRLIVVSGPAGSGKTTIVRRLVARPDARARLSVSATTRPPRPGEQDGREYLFHSRAEFEARRARGEFLEWAEVHGNLYGTPAGAVRESLARGECVILEIDVQGGMQVIERFPATVLVFVTAPDFSVLEGRLRGRQTEDEATVQLRLENARREVAMGERYHHRITNEDLDRAVDDLASLLHRLGCGGPERDA